MESKEQAPKEQLQFQI